MKSWTLPNKYFFDISPHAGISFILMWTISFFIN